MGTNYSFIPSTLTQAPQAPSNEGLPLYKELAYDFQSGQLKTVGGQYYYVEKNEALKIWIYKALKIPIDTYLAYSTTYGQEMFTLVGEHLPKPILKSELSRLIEETLEMNPYITGVTDFEVEQKGSKVTCSFIVNTVYGSFTESYESYE